MYRPFIKNIVPGKKSEIDKRSRAFPIPQTRNFFARTAFWSGSKMCAPTLIPLWKYVINLTNRSSNIYCPFSKSFSFFLTTLIGSARFHMIFLLSCNILRFGLHQFHEFDKTFFFPIENRAGGTCGDGHCALNGVLRGHFLKIKMLQWN